MHTSSFCSLYLCLVRSHRRLPFTLFISCSLDILVVHSINLFIIRCVPDDLSVASPWKFESEILYKWHSQSRCVRIFSIYLSCSFNLHVVFSLHFFWLNLCIASILPILMCIEVRKRIKKPMHFPKYFTLKATIYLLLSIWIVQWFCIKFNLMLRRCHIYVVTSQSVMHCDAHCTHCCGTRPFEFKTDAINSFFIWSNEC